MAIFPKHWSEEQHRRWACDRQRGKRAYVTRNMLTALPLVIYSFCPLLAVVWFMHDDLGAGLWAVVIGATVTVELLASFVPSLWRWHLHEGYFHKHAGHLVAVAI